MATSKAKPATSNVPAVKQNTALAVDERPDYIKQDDTRGTEGVGMEDLVIPRLEIVQSTSPCLDENEADYIKGSKAGALFNTVSRQLFPEGVMLVPVLFQKQYLIWRDRKNDPKAEGFFGAYDSEIEANEQMKELLAGGEQNLVVIPTAIHFCLIPRVLDDGTIKGEQIAISMARTKVKVSRRWNSLVQMSGGSRFSRMYLVNTVKEENAKGKYYNFNVGLAGYPRKEIYDQASALYDLIKSGAVKTVVQHGADDDSDDNPAEM